MSGIVAAHQQFWAYGTYQTSWMEAVPCAGDPAFAPLRRSFAPADLVLVLAERLPGLRIVFDHLG